ncbi:MAG: GFA family protein [Hyphomicrobiaceae bacterium]|nr:MAG: GFA family protein [Hyphomicrobiaceae bacterium]
MGPGGDRRHSGGCQCGAVRFAVATLGRASICHCRMCQKAFGSIGAPLVTAHGLTWTRGAPRHYQSSNKVRRGFCADCGTPLTYEYEGGIEVAIGAFDKAAEIAPVIQLGIESKLPWADGLAGLPTRSQAEAAKVAGFYASVVPRQHPDHDTAEWPPAKDEQP